MDALVSIRTYGDLLERHMFSDDRFAGLFSQYPVVWARYILKGRSSDELGLADKNWIRFAERHYSTIVRCWMAYEAMAEIESHCIASIGNPDAERHLRLHRLLFDFYCSMGAAIDNMGHTFDAAPVDSLQQYKEIRSDPKVDQNLEYLYQRRTQFIHKAVVPCFDENGLLSLDASMFEDAETQWDHQSPISVICVSSLVGFHWNRFVDQMSRCWSRLLGTLKSKSPSVKGVIKFNAEVAKSIEWSSGTPSSPSGIPRLPGPGPSGVR